MRLDYDCVRDVLLALEEMLQCTTRNNIIHFQGVELDDLTEKLSNKGYSAETIFYSAYNLEQAEFIRATAQYGDGGVTRYIISDITYEGHQFLGKIRPDSIWKQIKNGFSRVGAISLPIISSVATSLTTSLIKAQLKLP